ncbi:MAG: ATP-binding protein [Cyclobacteriaceae bacterium]|nr:ATP-binding protein [Cyclobacteriaceae bacterium]
MPEESLQFTVSASLFKQLGEQIAPTPSLALLELVKNAFDADATKIEIMIQTNRLPLRADLLFKPTEGGHMVITDNGRGMSSQELNEWVRFAPSEKKSGRKQQPTKLNRSAVGGKGLGKLATTRLGRWIELTSSDGSTTTQIGFDWQDFDGRSLTEVPIKRERKAVAEARGTSIIIHPIYAYDWDNLTFKQDFRERLQPFINSSFQVTLSVNGRQIPLKLTAPVKSRPVTLEQVWQKMTLPLMDEVIAFWESNQMLRSDSSLQERARQVVFLIRDGVTQKIVGLSTAGLVNFKQLNNNTFYLYRSIILPEYRHPGLADKLTIETRNCLENFNRTVGENKAIGILVFVENLKLQQFRREAIWRSSRMAYIGMDKSGRHIRVYYFKGARI